jgi:hypothetical protein
MRFTNEELEAILVSVEPEEAIEALANMRYKTYLKTEYWQMVRQVIHEKVGRKCEICGSEKFINVHHFNYNNRGMETLNDLGCLCEKCHSIIHYCVNGMTLNSIDNRIEFEEQIELANKIKEKFNNKRYIKLLPLSSRGLWTKSQMQELFGYSKKEVDKYLKDEVKSKLIINCKISCENGIREYYSLNRFLWYLIELDFPKVGD